MRSALIAVPICFVVLFSPIARAGDASDAAIGAARSYVDQLKAGNARQAVAERWDVDALLSGSFGLMYLELPKDQQTRAQAAFAEFVAIPFENEGIAQLFRTIEIEEATASVVNDLTVSVKLRLVGDEGRFRAENTLLLVNRGGVWRIADQRQGTQISIRASLVVMYAESAVAPGDTLPVVLERVLAGMRKQMAPG